MSDEIIQLLGRNPGFRTSSCRQCQTLERALEAIRSHLMENESGGAAENILARVREYSRTIEGLSRIGPEGLTPDQFDAALRRASLPCPERGDLLLVAGVGWPPEIIAKAALSADYQSPAGRAFQTGTCVAIANIADTKEFRLPDLLREHGIVSLLNVPVIQSGATWGVLEVDNTRPTVFDEWDVSFLTAVANLMGICIASAEASQQRIDAAAEVVRQQAEFDVAIHELQHRIKNNLQIIIAFLTQKVRELAPDVQEMLYGVVGRVQSVALAHDLLTVTKKTSNVDFDAYLRSLCRNLPRRPEIAVEVEAQHISIPIDRAVPAGLIVNELVTNSIKYAFGNSGGRIWVNFGLIGNQSEACVAIHDDGKGVEFPPKKGFGLTLIERLAQQIQGRIQHVKVTPGTRTVLCFPVPPSETVRRR